MILSKTPPTRRKTSSCLMMSFAWRAAWGRRFSSNPRGLVVRSHDPVLARGVGAELVEAVGSIPERFVKASDPCWGRPDYKVGGFAPLIYKFFPGPPGPARLQKSAISGSGGGVFLNWVQRLTICLVCY
jgi:hypothetical protein